MRNSPNKWRPVTFGGPAGQTGVEVYVSCNMCGSFSILFFEHIPRYCTTLKILEIKLFWKHMDSSKSIFLTMQSYNNMDSTCNGDTGSFCGDPIRRIKDIHPVECSGRFNLWVIRVRLWYFVGIFVQSGSGLRSKCLCCVGENYNSGPLASIKLHKSE